MAITYEDFQKALNSSGLANQFSQYDLDLAQQHPEFGQSILNLKQNWQSAATDEEKQAINDQANALRSSYGNYTGGADGSQYVSTGLLNNETDTLRSAVSSYAPFSYDAAAPTYTNQYAEEQAALLDAILNREDFSWTKETDPQWAPLKKEYLREGDRATANALAQASAASGGRASSYAVNAAAQAGDYYATQLTDKLPELYQQAYDRYLDEQQLKYSDLSALNAQEQLDYAKYLDELSQYNTDRSFAYNDYQTQYNMLQNAYENAMNQQQTEFNQNLTAQQYQDEIAAQQQELAQEQINAILAAGGTPSAELLGGSGYSNEYARDLADYYARQQALADAEQQRDLASYFAQYGDYSQLSDLGVNTGVLKQTQAAELAAQLADYGSAFLQQGVMPSDAMLSAMGITAADAQRYIAAVQAVASSYSSRSSSSSSSGSGGSSESSMTLTTAKQAASAGVFNDAVLSTLRSNGYTDDMLEAIYGYTGGGGSLYKTLTYQNLSDAAKKIADLMDSDLTTNYSQVIDMIGKLTDQNEQNYLLDQLSVYLRG